MNDSEKLHNTVTSKSFPIGLFALALFHQAPAAAGLINSGLEDPLSVGWDSENVVQITGSPAAAHSGAGAVNLGAPFPATSIRKISQDFVFSTGARPAVLQVGGSFNFLTVNPLNDFDELLIELSNLDSGVSFSQSFTPLSLEPYFVQDGGNSRTDWIELSFKTGPITSSFPDRSVNANLAISFTNGSNNLLTSVQVDDVFVYDVPEPGTFMLMAAGLAGLGFRKQASRRKSVNVPLKQMPHVA